MNIYGMELSTRIMSSDYCFLHSAKSIMVMATRQKNKFMCAPIIILSSHAFVTAYNELGRGKRDGMSGLCKSGTQQYLFLSLARSSDTYMGGRRRHVMLSPYDVHLFPDKGRGL
jgi:hypothetical protein